MSRGVLEMHFKTYFLPRNLQIQQIKVAETLLVGDHPGIISVMSGFRGAYFLS